MNVSVRSYLTSGLAVITAGAIMTAPTEPQRATAAAEGPPVALAAQVRPLQLPAPTTLALPSQLPGLLGQQVSFNAGVAIDFIVTGAQLIGRQLEVLGTLVAEIRNGTPVPVAVGRAVVSFTNIELDAGRELVGFGRELADFQIRFVSNLVSGLPAIVAVPAGNVLALGSTTVDTVSDRATGFLDDLAASLPVPVANARVQSASGAPVTESAPQSVQTGARHRLDDALTGLRHELKSSAVERDTADVGGSVSAPREHRGTHKFRDGVRGNAATAVSAGADKPNVRAEHQQRHLHDGGHNNTGGEPGQADHRKAND